MSDALLLTGAEGYVGQRLAERLSREVTVIGLGRRGTAGLACELMDEGALDEVARTIAPRWIIHAAGNKNIGACEKTPRLAYDANVRTAMNVLRAWPDVPMFYISTDYVFAGTSGSYEERSPVAPSTVYGKSKLCAEVTGQLIAPGRFTSVRVSALYDAEATFVRFLHGELREGRPVECFVDAFYSPTSIDDFADALLAMLTATDAPDIVHVAGERISRYQFARQFADACGYDADLVRPARLHSAATTLMPDLSLATPRAESLYGFQPTPHHRALRRLAQGVLHADAQPVSSVLRFPGPHARGDQRRSMGGDQLHRDRGLLRAGRTLPS
ncbi:MAG: NAD(P)-dependent oxidoreductase [Acidobacteria bacterium]|nr:NAD(P)-dependent oxidoreductase [Acidobacteriota bacterium]